MRTGISSLDRHLVPYHVKQGESNLASSLYIYPLARRDAPAEGRRSEGEGANLDRRLVPYHGKRKRIQSRIEFIYIYIHLFIYLFICINGRPFCAGVRRLGICWVLGKRLRKQKYGKQLDLNRIQSDEKKVEYSKAWVNET